VEVHEALHHGEAQAHATLGAIEAAIDLGEELEHAVEHLARNADAAVPNAQKGVIAIAVNVDAHRAALLGVLDGVADQVADDLLEAHPVATNELQRLDIGRVVERLALRGRVVRVEAVSDDLREVDGLGVEDDLAVGDARDVEQIVDQPREVVRLAIDHVELLLETLTRRVAPKQLG
jgi:hypothetical protein